MSIFFAARAVVVTAVALTAARVPLPVSQVPLVVGLTVVTAVSNLPFGDYESVKTVTSASASDGITLNVMVDLPSNDSKKTEHVSVTRHVFAADLKSSHAFKYLFTSGDQPEYPGTTAISTSASVVGNLRQSGKTEFGVDGESQGIGGLVSAVFGAMTSGNRSHVLSLGPNASGTLTAVGLATGALRGTAEWRTCERVNVQAWHLKGLLKRGDDPVRVECWIFDDPGNPLMLRYLIDKQKLQQVADIMQRSPS